MQSQYLWWIYCEGKYCIIKSPLRVGATTSESRRFFYLMNNENYFVVQGWMKNELKLKSNELMAFAIVYGFSQEKGCEYTGSVRYLKDALQCSRNTAISVLKSLCEKQLIVKTEIEINGVVFNKYRVSEQVVQILHGGCKICDKVVQNLDGGSANFAPNNIYINNNINKNLNIIAENKFSASKIEISEIENDDLKTEKTKRKKVAPKKEKEISHRVAIVDQWFKFYKSQFQVSPTFNAAEGKHLNSILSRFEKLATEKDKSENKEFIWPEDRALRTFEKFLINAWSDKWLQEHFILKNLASQFDSIINKKQLENGTKQTTSGGKKAYKFSIDRVIAKKTDVSGSE